MKYFAEIVTLVLVGLIVVVVILLMCGYPIPNTDLLAGIVGFAMREVAQSLNNFYNRRDLKESE